MGAMPQQPHLAVCSIPLKGQAEGRDEIQIFPAGEFGEAATPLKGTGPWRIDAAAAATLIARDAPRRKDMVIDYEHQTLLSRENGRPAPAAGWITPVSLEWRDDGLYAVGVRWTPRARSMIAGDEYRYLSPVFLHDEAGTAVQLVNVALTNQPAIDELRPVVLAAASRSIPINPETTPMLKAVRDLLGLTAENPTDAEIDAACAAAAARLTDAETKLAAASATRPDPARFVEVSVMQALQTEFAALKTQIAEKEVGELVEVALSDGRLLPAQETWARELGARDLASLQTYLGATPKIAALTGSQTRGKPPVPAVDASLPLEARCKAEWDGLAALRAEFTSLDAYTAFCRADAAGLVKQFTKSAQ
ncbi:MAG: phage protease [Methylotetracoccus sp.]